MQKLTAVSRNTGIDLLRGIVMIIMALDHTRDFFHQSVSTGDMLNPATTTPFFFFTRWITHLCAPTFVFLSGISAFLASQRRSLKDATTMLMKRGLFLIAIEIIFFSFGLSFNPLFNFIFLEVIWAIGCSFILLALCMKISNRFVLIIGVILFFGHNILDFFSISRAGVSGALWNIFFLAKGSVIPYAPDRVILVLYAILPWTGVMFMGYSIGHWFIAGYPMAKRIKNLRLLGAGFLLMYIVLRVTNIYGNPVPWENGDHPVMSFLNTEKYPPSLQFLGMTLGPALLLLSVFEKLKSGWGSMVQVYGRAPLFYFIVHFYLLHSLCMILFFASGMPVSKATEGFMLFRPNDFGYSLPVVYLIWIFVVVAMYYPCRWFYRYKQAHTQWWLKYI